MSSRFETLHSIRQREILKSSNRIASGQRFQLIRLKIPVHTEFPNDLKWNLNFLVPLKKI